MAKTVTHQDLKSYFGKRDFLEDGESKSFTQMIFELLSEKEPAKEELEIFELILNLSLDHGPDTPSAEKVINAAKEGKNISESVAAGIREINEHHGGAGEGLMEVLYEVKSEKRKVKNIVENYLEKNQKLPGFGHRLYKEKDPRAELIFDKLSVLGMGEEYMDITREIQTEFENRTGKHLPVNIDGAIACALCSFGWEPKLGIAVFIIARTPGLIGHYLNNVK